MTQYYCGKCNVKMNVSADVDKFECLIECPKCGAKIIADHREDLG
jgi:DNA-directed RNA polymerase subunit RPC12/RpoP